MDQLKAHVEFLRFGIEYNLTKAGVAVRDERGAISTEMAVVMAGLIAIAVVVTGILMSKAQSNANNIPDTVQAP
ncbi:MAG: hypothetical protein R2710_27515 [Acidimicrobiales bacterium]